MGHRRNGQRFILFFNFLFLQIFKDSPMKEQYSVFIFIMLLIKTKDCRRARPAASKVLYPYPLALQNTTHGVFLGFMTKYLRSPFTTPTAYAYRLPATSSFFILFHCMFFAYTLLPAHSIIFYILILRGFFCK